MHDIWHTTWYKIIQNMVSLLVITGIVTSRSKATWIKLESRRIVKIKVVGLRISFVTNQEWVQLELGCKTYGSFTIAGWMRLILGWHGK